MASDTSDKVEKKSTRPNTKQKSMNGNIQGGSVKIAMMRGFFLAYIALGLPFLQACGSPSPRNAETIGYRLPDTISPELYQLDILTNLADTNENFTFQGKVCIQVKCNTATDKIILHSKNLQIHESEVIIKPISDESETAVDGENNGVCANKCQEENKTHLKVLNHCYHDDYELYIIQLSEKLQAGSKYTIYIPFEGELKPDLAGYYRSSYKDLKTGEQKWMTVTQFESTDARKAFPCFDEPIFKARFQVNLGHINTRSSISNMRKISTTPIEGMDNWVWDHYETTVPMSTYLLAFIVSDFDYKESPKSSNNVLFRVWARKDAIDQVDFAAFVGPKVLEYYEKYFNIKYPLPKQDMIAIPDFSSGAMENWGLITYREVALLYDPKVSTKSSQPFIASVIAHELAHQWFGNLVTMKWWTDLWLNEGFATYVAGLGVHYLYPEWNSLDEEVVDNSASVFFLDSLKSSHPISVPIGHPSEIAQIFDTISYKKGSSVIRMMNLFLGEETFREGVSNYLRENAYGNAEQDDLWKSLSEAAHKSNALSPELTVKEIMDTWTLQTGYPLITVVRNYNDGTATVSQKKYLADRTSATADDGTTWWVPLSYTTEKDANFNDTKPKTWIPKSKRQVVIEGLPADGWVIMNVQIAGVYRVNYDQENWEKLIKTMNTDHKKIGVLNRVQLIEDSFALAKTGDIDYSIVFNLVDYVRQENEFLPWKTLLRGMGYLDKMLRLSTSYDLYREYVKNLLKPTYERLARVEFDNKPENLQMLKHQKQIASWACKFGVGDCRARAIASFQEWMKEADPDKNNPIERDSRGHVYCTAIKYGGEEEWDFLWKRYSNSNVGSEGKLILSALSCTREVWLLNRYLEWAFSKIRRQDSSYVFTSIAHSDTGYYLAKSFVKSRIADIYAAYEAKANKMGLFVSSLASQIDKQSDLDDLTEFTKQNEQYFRQSEQQVKQSLENAKVNIQWHDKYYQNVIDILGKYTSKKAE